MKPRCRGVYPALLVPLLVFYGLTFAHSGMAEEVARMGFNVKIARDLNRGEVQAAMGLWGEELSRKFGVPAEVLFYDDMTSLRRDFDLGKVNFVIAAGMDFARHFRAEELAEGFRGEVVNDQTLLLLTHNEARVADLSDLAGKRIVVLAEDELSQVYLETLCLRHYQRPCKQVFASIDSVANSNQLMMRLFFRKADLALSKRSGFETARELNPQIGKAVRELARFPMKATYYGFYSRKVSPDFRQRSLRLTPTMHQEARGRQALEILKLDRLVIAPETELQPVYALLAEYEGMRARAARAGR